MQGGDYGGYYIQDYDGGVYAYNPAAENGVVWNNVTNRYIMGDHSYYSSSNQTHWGIDGRYYMIDCADESMSEIDNPNSVTFGLFFLGWIFNEYSPTNEDYGTTLCYSLHTNNGAFAVRWTAKHFETGDEMKFCYIGICAPQVRSGDDPDASAKLINLGINAHPFSASGDGDQVALREQIDQLQATITQMETDHASEIADLNATHANEIDYLNGQHDAELDLAKKESYNSGYDAGVEDAGSGISIDTSDPVNAILGFFAVLFKGIRDFALPILGVEISGVTILTMVGVIGLILFVGLVIAIIAKVRGG